MVLLDSKQWWRGVMLTVVLAPMLLSSAANSEERRASDSLAALYNNLGVVVALNGDLEQAELYFDSALVLSGENASVYNNLGNLYLCAGSVQESLEHYEHSHALDTLDKRRLFNWSLALYLSDSVDLSTSAMEEFLDYSDSVGSEDVFVAALLEEMPDQKGAKKKISKAEVKKLMEKAKKDRNKALKKKGKEKKGVTRKPAAKEGKTSKKTKATAPAGEKSLENSDISALLYWILL